jgi:hypothetical protein
MIAQTPIRTQPHSNTLPDEHIEFWAGIYADCGLKAYGILFSTFVAYPLQILGLIDTGRLPRLDTSAPNGDTSMQTSTPEQRAAVLDLLRHHIGRAAGITARELVAAVNARHPATKLNERDLRVVATDLRMEGHHLCAHPSTGYFIASTPDELEETLTFLRQRAMSSLRQVAAMKHVSMPDLCGQLHLNT